MPAQKKEITMIITSDIHYLSPHLNDKGALFRKTMNTADGKHTLFIEEIVSAFLEEVRELQPDYLLISGDLTFNGEKLSHLDLAEKLEELKEEGIQPLVIPGNHDVSFPFSCKYHCDCCYPAENITAGEFKEIYGNCGYDRCLTRDPASLSYIYPLSEDIWLFCLDANVNDAKGSLSPATMQWLEVWLKYAAEQEKIIFTMTHQNILSHNLLTSPGYVLFNNEEVYHLLNRYNATLNFSGHMHIQHIKSLGHLTTIASGSLAVSPNLYGVMTISADRQIDYSAKSTNVEAWARKHQISSHKLKNFSRESRTYFNQVWGWQINQELDDFHVSPLERVGLVDFCTRVLNIYLAGCTFLYRKYFLEHPLYKKWKETAEGSYFQAYIESILEDPANSTSDIELHIQANLNRKEKNPCCEED